MNPRLTTLIFSVLLSLSFVFTNASCAASTTPSNGANDPLEFNPVRKPTPPTDRIFCRLGKSNYQLILITRDPKLPENVGAIALKNDADILIKVAAHMSIVDKTTLEFEEIGQQVPKRVELTFQTKIAVVSSFGLTEIPDGTQFACEL